MALDTLANVKTALLVTGTADDAALTRLMDAAESVIEQHTGRQFAGGSFTETHPAGGRLLFLRNFPVTTVTSLRVDPARQFGTDTERATDAYVLHADRGVVESLTGPFLPAGCRGQAGWPEAVQVTYSTATGAVPPAVQQAFAELVGHWYREAKTNADAGYLMLTELTSGTDTKSYSWSLTSGLTMPPGVLELLEPFRVPAV
jgi:uncharacterized phiE125 gp8 family phage protein